MRTVIISNYSAKPPRILGIVTLDNKGLVKVSGDLQPQLEAGVSDQRRGKVQPSDGAKFLDAVLVEFRGAYIRATE